MKRVHAFAVVAITVMAFAVPSISQAGPEPVYVCGGVAPQTSTCTNGTHDQVVTLASHGSLVVTPAFVGRLRSTIHWTKGSQTGFRSYACDFKNPQDYVDPLGTNCAGTGTWPPDCIDTTPECTVKYRQVCKASAWKSDSGNASGPWECDNAGL